MSPVDPPTRCERLTYAAQLLRFRCVNFLARYVDLDDLYKADGRAVVRRVALASVFCLPPRRDAQSTPSLASSPCGSSA